MQTCCKGFTIWHDWKTCWASIWVKFNVWSRSEGMYPVCKLLWVSGVAVPPEPVCLGMNVQVELIWRLKNWIWRQNCHGDMLWILRDTDRLNRKLKTTSLKQQRSSEWHSEKFFVNVLYAWGGGDPVANWHDCIIERWGKQWKSSVGEDSCWISFHWTADLKGNQK